MSDPFTKSAAFNDLVYDHRPDQDGVRTSVSWLALDECADYIRDAEGRIEELEYQNQRLKWRLENAEALLIECAEHFAPLVDSDEHGPNTEALLLYDITDWLVPVPPTDTGA